MQALKKEIEIKQDGKISLENLPFKKGEKVEVILLSSNTSEKSKPKKNMSELLQLEAIGIWRDRNDISDSIKFADKLRSQSQNRNI